MMPLLEQIEQENDIKKIPSEKLPELAMELRRFLLTNVSHTGGHLAANLGVVELTMALHLFMDFPEDKLIWDVGHQSYVHKILTGRREQFSTLRQYGGISGFPKPSESNCDAFATGHSSTSLSAALGFVKARELRGGHEKIVAVIGDGALSGGMAFEALNNAGRLKSNLTIILNDNKMSISENVGAMANYLGKIRTNPAYIKFKDDLANSLSRLSKNGPKITNALKRTKDSVKHLFVGGMLFENIGLTYIGPIDGHNLDQMKHALERAAMCDNATLIHVVTQKGKGYRQAEQNPVKFHGIDPFNRRTGEIICKKKTSYTDVFGKAIVQEGKNSNNLCVITAAMKYGTGLNEFAEQFPERFFDVGIAEEHAVTFAAGLAAGGYHPVVAIYSTFLQRSYDQILHDVCMEQLPVVFTVDRTGIIENDGETHQGIYTSSFLSHIPGLILMEASEDTELQAMLSFALKQKQPCAICYPRRAAFHLPEQYHREVPVELGKARVICEGDSGCAILAVGPALESAFETVRLLQQEGINISLVDARFVAPADDNMIYELAQENRLLITMEENVKRGGFGEYVAVTLLEHKCINTDFWNLSLPDGFLCQGNLEELRVTTGTDAVTVAGRIKNYFRGKKE